MLKNSSALKRSSAGNLKGAVHSLRRDSGFPTMGIDRCNISNNVLEQDHRAIKRRVRASQHFRSFWGAWRTIAGYEAIHMIRKGQACWSAVGAKVGLLHRFILDLFAAMS
jgi:transposase-like protein